MKLKTETNIYHQEEFTGLNPQCKQRHNTTNAAPQYQHRQEQGLTQSEHISWKEPVLTIAMLTSSGPVKVIET